VDQPDDDVREDEDGNVIITSNAVTFTTVVDVVVSEENRTNTVNNRF